MKKIIIIFNLLLLAICCLGQQAPTTIQLNSTRDSVLIYQNSQRLALTLDPGNLSTVETNSFIFKTATGLRGKNSIFSADSTHGWMGIGTGVPTSALTLSSTAGSTGINIFNTSDQITNTEYLSGKWASNTFLFDLLAAGTGTGRTWRIRNSGNTTRVPQIILGGGNSNTSNIVFSDTITGTGSNVAVTGYMKQSSISSIAKAFTVYGIGISNGTASNIVMDIALKDSTHGSGTQYLLRGLRVASTIFTASTDTVKFSFDGSGNFFTGGTATIGTVASGTSGDSVTQTHNGLIGKALITGSSGVLVTNGAGSIALSASGLAGTNFSNAIANSVFGNNTSGSAGPDFQTSLALSGTGSFLGFLGAGITSPAAQLHISGSVSAANSGASGIGLRTDAATYANTTSSGTVAAFAVHAIGQPTLTATSSTTYTLGSTLTIAGAPVSSTNVTQTTSVALNVASGLAAFQGGLASSTALSSSNLGGNGGGGLAAFTQANLLFGGASTVQVRAWANGTTSTVATANTSIANFIAGAVPITEATSGVHNVVTNMAVLAPTITNGSATTTDATALYVQGAPTGITPTNPATALWVASGTARFDGAVTSATVITAPHFAGSGSAPTSNSLGTNVTSATVTGTDGGFKVTVVTSAAVSGTICLISFASAYASTPTVVFSPADVTTSGGSSSMAMNATSASSITFAGVIPVAGTYIYNATVR